MLKDINMVRGDTLSIQFELDKAIDIEDAVTEITFSVKENKTDNEYIFQRKKANVTTVAENTYIMRIEPQATADLIPGRYYYDLELKVGTTQEDYDVFTLIYGQLELITDITLRPIDYPEFVYPDINGDGIIDGRDSTLILSAYANISAGEPSGLTTEQEALADVDKDGKITAKDASYVMSFYAECVAGAYENNSAGWIEFMRANYNIKER